MRVINFGGIVKTFSLVCAVFLMFANVASACPDLQGTYLCKTKASDNGIKFEDRYLTLVQAPGPGKDWRFFQQLKGVDSGKTETTEFVTDGVEREFQWSSGQKYLLLANCDGAVLHEKMTVEFQYGKLHMDVNWMLTPEKDLLDRDSGYVCKRQ